jgi:hypothetical protein
MKILENTIMDGSESSAPPIIPGTYPAHCTAFENKEWNESHVFNLKFTIAPEVSNLQITQMFYGDSGLEPVLASDGSKKQTSAGYLKGKEFRANGIWLTPSPAEGESWKNKKYTKWCESLGVPFQTDDDGNTQLGLIEESDVLGNPCLIKIATEEYTNKEGQTKSAFKVTEIYPWAEGNKIDADEIGVDVPF